MKKILFCVDADSQRTLRYLTLFIQEGHKLIPVDSPQTALKALTGERFDLIVLSFCQPELNAGNILGFVRLSAENKVTPVVAVVLNGEIQGREALRAGANKCVVRGPNEEVQVLQAVRQCFDVQKPAPPPVPPPASAHPAIPKANPPVPKSAAPGPRPAPAPASTTPVRERVPIAHLKTLVAELYQANETRHGPMLQKLSSQVESFVAGTLGEATGILPRLLQVFLKLVKDLEAMPARLTPSSRRTLSQLLDTIGFLQANPAASDKAAGASYDILSVDDSQTMRRIVGNALTSEHFRIDTAESGEKALEKVSGQRYDLYLLDIEMPGMSGIDLSRKLRAHPTSRDTPIVFLTALDDFETRLDASQSGGRDFIAKPFTEAELVAKVWLHLLGTFVQGAATSSPQAKNFVSFGR